jgi:hypothetical protein
MQKQIIMNDLGNPAAVFSPVDSSQKKNALDLFDLICQKAMHLANL